MAQVEDTIGQVTSVEHIRRRQKWVESSGVVKGSKVLVCPVQTLGCFFFLILLWGGTLFFLFKFDPGQHLLYIYAERDNNLRIRPR